MAPLQQKIKMDIYFNLKNIDIYIYIVQVGNDIVILWDFLILKIMFEFTCEDKYKRPLPKDN